MNARDATLLWIERRARDLQRRIDSIDLRSISAAQRELALWQDFTKVFGNQRGKRQVLLLDCLGRPWNDSWNVGGVLYDSNGAVVSVADGNTVNGWLSFSGHNGNDNPVTITAGGAGTQTNLEPFNEDGSYQVQVTPGYLCFACGLINNSLVRTSSDQNTFSSYQPTGTPPYAIRTRSANVINMVSSGGFQVCGSGGIVAGTIVYTITLDANGSGTPRATIVMQMCGSTPAGSWGAVVGSQPVGAGVTTLTAQALATSFSCNPDTGGSGSFTATFDFAGSSVQPYLYPTGSTLLTLTL